MSNVIFEDNSAEVLVAMKNALVRGFEAIGMKAETYTKDNTPVRTGRLRNSMTHAVDEDEPAAYIGTNVNYGIFVENGTQKQKANHMLRRAATEHTDEYKRLLEESMKNA